ncbi:MAG: hypothetical protein ABIR83_11570 [Nakamurella sp.]
MTAGSVHTDRALSVQVELAALRTERSVLLADRERSALQLAAVQADLDRTSADLAALAALVDRDSSRRRSDEAADLAVELAAARRDRDLAYEELLRTRVERDQLRIDQLRWELMSHLAEEADGDGSVDEDPGQVAALREQLAASTASTTAVRQELAAYQRTVSWRLTAPLRTVRRWQLSR